MRLWNTAEGVVHEGHGIRYWLEFHAGAWTVLVSAATIEDADLIAGAVGLDTPGGYVVVTADPPIALSDEPGEGEGPEVTIGDREPRGAVIDVENFTFVTISPVAGQRCVDTAEENVGGNTKYAGKCLGGPEAGGFLFAQIYGPPEFVNAVYDGLEARNVTVAGSG